LILNGRRSGTKFSNLQWAVAIAENALVAEKTRCTHGQRTARLLLFFARLAILVAEQLAAHLLPSVTNTYLIDGQNRLDAQSRPCCFRKAKNVSRVFTRTVECSGMQLVLSRT